MRWPWTAPFRRRFHHTRPVRRPQCRHQLPLRLEPLEDRVTPAVITVNTTADTIAIDGLASLREAITSVNNQADVNGDVTLARVGGYASTPGGTPDVINFDIPAAGVQTISLTSALPTLIKKVTINGLSQTGAAAGAPLIVLNGAGAGLAVNGLTLGAGSDSSTVEGLVLQGFTAGSNGLVINGSSSNTVTDNFIGTDAAGTAKVANGGFGILIEGAAKSNTVGGTTAALANVISGNASGVLVTGTGTSSNLIEGNIVGLDKNGSAALGNTTADVAIEGGATANTVGGTTAGTANTLSAAGFGVYVIQAGTSQNLIAGNFIGTDKTGNQQHGNGIGVVIGVGATANTVGGTTATAANVISGNFYGVLLSDSGSNNNTVQGNLIGTNAAGTGKLPNSIGIVVAFGSSSNAIGGSAAGAANVLSANTYGLVLAAAGTANNVVAGNLIGTDKNGTSTLANSGVGVLIETGAASNTVGGTAAGAGNVISFNQVGVFLDGGTTKSNALQGNLIGTDKSGTVAAGNVVGVQFQNGANSNTVGGTLSGAGNTIAFNINQGVIVGSSPTDTATVGDSIVNNSIFGNGALGIDLGADGPTANGANPRSFPNDGQNFPLITASGGNTVSGTLTSAPNTMYTIQFFQSPSGLTGQGQQFLGADTGTTDGNGNFTFTGFTLNAPITSGDVLTATATNQTNFDTSEFSR
jgi:titin